MTQTIFKVGNSNVVAIPSGIMKQLQLVKGQEVIVEHIPETDSIVITPKKSNHKKATKAELQKWLDGFLTEDAALLDELAHR